jgi:hypothetical protein
MECHHGLNGICLKHEMKLILCSSSFKFAFSLKNFPHSQLKNKLERLYIVDCHSLPLKSNIYEQG